LLFFFFKVQEDFFKVSHGHIKALKWHSEGAASNIKATRPPSYSGYHHGKRETDQQL